MRRFLELTSVPSAPFPPIVDPSKHPSACVSPRPLPISRGGIINLRGINRSFLRATVGAMLDGFAGILRLSFIASYFCCYYGIESNVSPAYLALEIFSADIHIFQGKKEKTGKIFHTEREKKREIFFTRDYSFW